MRRKHLVRNRRGTAEIVGTVLFLVILLFFFANVFLWHNQVSRETNQVVADKINSPIRLEVTTASSTDFVSCTSDPTFGGFGRYPITGPNSNNPDPLHRGPPYGMIISGEYSDTATKDGVRQILSETGDLTYDGLNEDYMCLNATYAFVVNQDFRLMKAITISFYGSSSDAEGEDVDVYLYDVQLRGFINTGLKILKSFDWYNITVPNPERYIDRNGVVKVNYLSSRNSYYWDESAYLTLYIDCQLVSVNPISLVVSDLGGKDVKLERLWITQVSTGEHSYTDLSKVSNGQGNLKEVWVAAGSSLSIMFGSVTIYDESKSVLTIDYQPPPGKVIFKAVTNLGNTATVENEFPS